LRPGGTSVTQAPARQLEILLLDRGPHVADRQPLRGQAIGIDVQPKMLEACGARKVMNTSLGDPNFHTHDRIEAKTADRWKELFKEEQLSIETRRLMDAIGVVRPG